MILVIDNYDSFTFNLVHYLMELGAEVDVQRNDAVSAAEAMAGGAKGIVLSPGPCTPDDAGITLGLVEACANAKLPLLGVCLGHQAIGQHFGARVVRGGLMHGKTSAIAHDGSGVFEGLPDPFNRHPLSFADRRRRAGATGGERHRRRRCRDGIEAREPADPRGTVPSRKHRQRTGAPAARQFHDAVRARTERRTGMSMTQDEARDRFGAILDGEMGDEEIATFLVALSERGETAEEIAGAAQSLRARLIPVAAPDDAIDVCGTGGDGHHTLNVSTAVSLVVAALGIPVAKHGNRAASSKAGAADTLEALGLDMEAAGRTAERTLGEIGICFLFAKNHHPAMTRIQPIRQRIGRRTIFNLMGPLSNPAGVRRQLIGIARPAYVPIYADAMSRLGSEHTMIVSGDEGLDELSLAGGNEVAHVRGDEWSLARLDARESDLSRASVEAIRGGSPTDNAKALAALLEGEAGAYRDAVLLNAAVALEVAGDTCALPERVARAAEAIDNGAAETLLDRWIAIAR